MYDNRDNIDFAHTNTRKLFASIFFPTLLGMLFSMAFIFTDGIFVGHGIGSHGLAAINLIGPIMMLINGLGMMLGVGVSVVAAIHMSQNNIKAARINVTQAYMAGILIAFIVGLFCYIFPDTVLQLLGVKNNSGLYPFAREYYLWFLPTCLLMMVETIGLFVIRLDGSPRYAMLSNIVPAIVNVALDYIFIFPCKMGLMGAALATDIGGLVSCCMVAYYMLFRTKTLNLYRLKNSMTSIRLALRNVGYMIKVGNSSLVGELAVAVMMLTGNRVFMNYLGDDGVAAYSVACYLFPLVYMIYSAVAQSAQPIISYNYGAGETGRIHSTVRFSLSVSVLLGLAISAIFMFFASAVVSCFLDSSESAYKLAAHGLPYYASGFVFMAVNICVVGFLQSVERSFAATLFTVLRGILFLVGAFIILPEVLGTAGLWLAIPCAELLTTLCIIVYSIISYNKSKSKKNIDTEAIKTE
jgi:putative MATE family efflux protein